MYFEYWVTYWNEVDEVTDYASGVVYADTYSEATQSIVECYGDDCIEKLEIRTTDSDCVYECEVHRGGVR